jgi:hypothetical protein
MSNSQLLARTQELSELKQECTRQRELVGVWLARFELKPSEVNVLDGDEVNEEFLQALQRISQIRSDCKQLLHTYQHRAGLDVLDSLSKRLDVGYEKL